MHHGLGSLAASTVFCGPMSQSTTTGSTSKKTRSELDWLSSPKIGSIKSDWTIGYSSASRFVASSAASGALGLQSLLRRNRRAIELHPHLVALQIARLVEHKIRQPAPAISNKSPRPSIDEICEENAVARFYFGPDRV